MDAVPIVVALGGILVAVASVAFLRRERARARTQARERARSDDEFRRERAADACDEGHVAAAVVPRSGGLG